jgi:fido (protein-threonine AMPylation protein)
MITKTTTMTKITKIAKTTKTTGQYALRKEDLVVECPPEIQTELLYELNEKSLRIWLKEASNSGDISRSGQRRVQKKLSKKEPIECLNFLGSKEPHDQVRITSELRNIWANHTSGFEALCDSLDKPVAEGLCHSLHKVMTQSVYNVSRPYGSWRCESAYTGSLNQEGNYCHLGHSNTSHVPELMTALLKALAQVDDATLTLENAHLTYTKFHAAFMMIKPFCDGNGRVARLLANLPLLRAGLPPLELDISYMSPTNLRREYTEAMGDYHLTIGILDTASGLWPCETALAKLSVFFQKCYRK